ncbi:uncharacterized protein [Pseudorasbora parva]|uniref:uncharacterized protein n=1 Tax=Pseudorasbora parva TaxID=51549 RepID=UPI00351F540E
MRSNDFKKNADVACFLLDRLHKDKMAPRHVCALIIYIGAISVTGLLASWVMGVERTEIKLKSSINLFTIRSDAAQTEKTTLAGTSAVTECAPNTQKAEIITNFPATSMVSSAVASAELSGQTTAETAASAAGSVETTAEGTITLSETLETFKTPILPVTEKAKLTKCETVTASTQIEESTNVETSTNTAQKTPEPERIPVSDFKQTHKSETEVGITVPQPNLGTTGFAQTKANIKCASQIPEPVTDTSKLKTSKITSENKATTFIDLTEGTLAPSTFIKRLKTTGTEPSKVETSETTTVRPQETTQAIKTSHNGAAGINLMTTIQTATGTKEKTVGKQLSTEGADITRKGRRGPAKTPLTHDKTLYAAITMGCILVICAILALIVFIMDFIGD